MSEPVEASSPAPHASLTPETVRHLARLARLALGDDEVRAMTVELGKILEHVRALEAVDTEGVEPTAHVHLARMPLRDDEPRAGVDREVALAAAPRRGDEAFVVPQVVEG